MPECGTKSGEETLYLLFMVFSFLFSNVVNDQKKIGRCSSAEGGNGYHVRIQHPLLSNGFVPSFLLVFTYFGTSFLLVLECFPFEEETLQSQKCDQSP